MWASRRSVRTRTTLGVTVVVGLALALGGWLLVRTLERSLVQQGDASARTWVRELADLARRGDLPRALPVRGDDLVAEVVAADGRELASTPRLADRRSIGVFPTRRVVAVHRVDDLPVGSDDVDYRVWGRTADSPDGPVSVYVGVSQDAVEEAAVTLSGLLLRAFPLVLALVAAAVWVTVGRSLGPVERVRREVAGITDVDLDRRVPVPLTGDEIEDLARTMNRMLDRLAAASARQRAFVADASHELQSPLAGLRTEVELALAQADDADAADAADWSVVGRELLTRVQEMESLVHDLLYLARDGDAADLPVGQVDLDDVVLDEVARLRVSSAVLLDTSGVSAGPVLGSRSQLGRLVRNLLENAVRHADERVTVSVRNGTGCVELVVADDGPGIPPADRERVFQRFVRLDTARTGAGSGLGLSIAEAIAQRHGGTLTVDGGHGGAALLLRLPASDLNRT